MFQELNSRPDELLKYFLETLKLKKVRERDKLMNLLEITESDIEYIKPTTNLDPGTISNNSTSASTSLSSSSLHQNGSSSLIPPPSTVPLHNNLNKNETMLNNALNLTRDKISLRLSNIEHLQGSSLTNSGASSSSSSSKRSMKYCDSIQRAKRQIYDNFDAFENDYSNYIERTQYSSLNRNERLNGFKTDLDKFTGFSEIRPLAIIAVPATELASQTMISSIEFDCQSEYFAIAGLARTIKIYEYEPMIRDNNNIRIYPIKEIEANAKISCLSWNPYYRSMMSASDYGGLISIYDVVTGTAIMNFQEHEKRCWSIDFNRNDCQLLASGSDDWTVKLWNVNHNGSIHTIHVQANILSVQFNPVNSNHLAFCCADKKVFYWDLRKTSEPLLTFNTEHSKSVSYVRFLNEHELVTASTDNQIKLWNTNYRSSLRSFSGHVNEKRFIGLSTHDDYFCCGSEDNSVYVYYKGVERKILSFSFNSDYVSLSFAVSGSFQERSRTVLDFF